MSGPLIKVPPVIVISAFPGTGKTYCAENFHKIMDYRPPIAFIDFDSSAFSGPNFPNNYLDAIQKITEQPNKVTTVLFTSSHKEVRDGLSKRNMIFIFAYPSKQLKSEYLRRYKERGSSDTFINKIDYLWDTWLDEINLEIFSAKSTFGGKKSFLEFGRPALWYVPFRMDDADYYLNDIIPQILRDPTESKFTYKSTYNGDGALDF